MSSSRARSSDVKLLVAATLTVLTAGLLVAGALLLATRGSHSPVCGELNVGSATELRRTLQRGGAVFNTTGGGCSFWLALDDGDIVAYKVRQPVGCTLNLRDRGTRWVCGGQTLDASDLAQYPVSIRRIGQIDAVVVDLGPAPGASVDLGKRGSQTPGPRLGRL